MARATPQHPLWQAMLSGSWYQTRAKGLAQARAYAKELCWQFNCSDLSETERDGILARLLPNARNIQLSPPFYCDYGANIHAGSNVSLAGGVTILDAGEVHIGANTRVGAGVVVCALHHPLDAKRRNLGWQRSEPIFIGSNVEIGNNVTILPGARIPDGSVITDNSVVRG
ncbi:sugar O-acetyltransferase [Alteromonas aestuariivivens]|uniref:Sugar O-acetyltransferase n=2 Tax=Alteromonas aestuariivivens TaxID=1938339 RepID=A0A3D8M6P4_9ALTE|nr:sugar O-acetyltransferase [Alteromonas aestuariivivens]